jgi:transcriptional regulator
VRLYRIGDKVVSEDKLRDAISAILEDREAGATQDDVARSHGVQRSFVSFLETLG